MKKSLFFHAYLNLSPTRKNVELVDCNHLIEIENRFEVNGKDSFLFAPTHLTLHLDPKIMNEKSFFLAW